MEKLMTETISFAEIRPYLDHCPIDGGKKSSDWVYLTKSNPKTSYIEVPDKQRKIKLFEDTRFKRKCTIYKSAAFPFGNNDSNHVQPFLGYFTQDDNTIKQNFVNPFCDIMLHDMTISVSKDENSISIKCSIRKRHRRENCKFFRTTNEHYGLKFNTKNGNIYSYTVRYKGSVKRKISTIRVNTYTHIQQILHMIIHGFRRNLSSREVLGTMVNKTHEEIDILNSIDFRLNHTKFLHLFFREIGVNDVDFDNSIELNHHDYLKFMIGKSISVMGIKMPNNGYHNLLKDYPGKKFLNKNDNKLMSAILDSYGIKSKFTIKLFHQYPNINLFLIKELSVLFGEKYPKYLSNIRKENYDLWGTSEKTEIVPVQIPIESRRNTTMFSRFDIVDTERDCVIKLINDVSEENPPRNRITSLLSDHFSMIKDCRPYYPELKFTSTNWSSFNDEHMRLSRIVKKIKSGMTIEYVYDNRIIRDIETVINNIKPYILKTDEDYSEEGTYMHHCVATYSTKEISLIVSLRMLNSKDRVTCEFNKKTGELVQSRYFNNENPPEEFLNSITTISRKVRKHAKNRMINHLEVRKIPIKINGIEVSVDTQTHAGHLGFELDF